LRRTFLVQYVALRVGTRCFLIYQDVGRKRTKVEYTGPNTINRIRRDLAIRSYLSLASGLEMRIRVSFFPFIRTELYRDSVAMLCNKSLLI
jgi:hypothetical protein